MRVLVFGAGAIGSLLGGILAREHDVTIVGRGAHVDAVNRRGLHISGHTTLLAWPMATTTVPQETFDVVFVTTKAYDTAAAVDALRSHWRQSVFVTLQNGLGNAERIASAADHVLAGTTTHGVTFVAPGEIVHAGRGDTCIGPWHGTTHDDAQRVADMLTAAGVATTVTANARREVWAKVVVNAAINPLTAVLRRPNGALLEADDLRRLLDRIAREGVAAARAAGVDLDADELAGKVAEVASRTAGNRSSMLQDVERGRRTEIEAIVGELLRVADEKGVACPYLRTLFALVHGHEQVVRG